MSALARQAQELFSAGRPSEAREAFATLAGVEPDHAPWWFAWGACELAIDAPREALMPLERACALPQPPPLAWLYLALARQRAGRGDWAAALLRAQSLLQGDDLLQVARAWMAGGRPDQVEALTTGPLSQFPDALLLRAQLARRRGDPEQAAALCRQILVSPHPFETGNAALSELGHALDKLGHYTQAWLAFETRNMRQWQDVKCDVDLYPRQLTELAKTWDTHAMPPLAEPPDDGPAPVFLLGFPRSGTTLTEQVLARHSRVTTLDERRVLMEVALDFLQERGLRYPRDLVRLTAAERRALRSAYRSKSGMDDVEVQDKLFVDKLPLNWPDLPLARAMFPESRVVVLLRDPRDSCLSALMQDFLPNEAMVQFLVPERTGALYNQVRTLGERYAQVEGLQAHRLHYEDLVREPETQARALLDYVGLDWDERVLTPHEGVSGRYISTPSRHQVARPIHTGSIGRYQNYPQVVERLGVDGWVSG